MRRTYSAVDAPLPSEGAPTNFRHWTGRIGVLPVARAYKVLGSAPRPETRWEWFWFDVHHGRLMQYPWLSVYVFAVRGIWASWQAWEDNHGLRPWFRKPR